ncbi:MAG: hypothetical protein IT189_01675 [Microbacteriaceae bacterium]|jgi:flavodoxin|uniref:flavodoxin n=1 Tax=unclassified Microbacterium TaxID=2609290 RepID=UPI0024B63D91|nr:MULTISPECIES: flavodoxin [unclassified Microbacterium]MBT9608286.1 hypothetical protein [Microbacterium sp.]MCC6854749.1 hypothetical protein [Microbacteriaceae bacterium]MDI9889565.1 flavodoxin [Microbacterium sp. IEGM 1404]
MLRTALGVLSVGALAGLAACAPPLAQRPMSTPTSSASGSGRVLLVYFSRAGENYYYGDRRTLDVGNTEVVARMISDRIGCDVFRIEAADPYPADYEQTVARNVREEQQDARPAIAGTIPSLEDYDTIVLGSPVWNVRAPMIMWTFADAVDWSGKRVLPFVTYAVSDFGSVVDDYTKRLGAATIGEGLAVQGETATDATDDVARWLAHVGLDKKEAQK